MTYVSWCALRWTTAFSLKLRPLMRRHSRRALRASTDAAWASSAASGAALCEDACGQSGRFCGFSATPLGCLSFTFVDTPGFALSEKQGGILRAGAALIGAYAEATVPLITVITGKAIGGGYVAMASRALGADMAYAWPQAQISCLSEEASAIVMDAGKVEELASPFEAAGAGLVDEVIYPAETRQRIAGALELAIGKRENRLPKKHGVR